MLNSIIKKNINLEKEKTEKIQKELNEIYKLLTSSQSKEKRALELLDKLLYKKVILNDIPQSLNIEGCMIMTFSKFWMIIIFINLNQLKKKDDKIYKFLELVNFSLYHNLNEKDEYKKFFYELCEEYFDDNIAFNTINLNPYLENKLTIHDHIEIKKHYVYLLNNPFSFEAFPIRINDTNKRKNIENEEKEETIKSFNKLSKELKNLKGDCLNNKNKESENKKDNKDEKENMNIEKKENEESEKIIKENIKDKRKDNINKEGKEEGESDKEIYINKKKTKKKIKTKIKPKSKFKNEDISNNKKNIKKSKENLSSDKSIKNKRRKVSFTKELENLVDNESFIKDLDEYYTKRQNNEDNEYNSDSSSISYDKFINKKYIH